MENDEINKLIHEKVIGGKFTCDTFEWCPDEPAFPAMYACRACLHKQEGDFADRICPDPEIEDYCTDLNAVAKAEAKVIEKVGDEYAKYLSGVLFETNKENYSEAMQILIYATATAEQRARAVLAAMGIEVK